MAAIGDVIYRGSSVWKRLVGNTTTTAKYLKQTGTGSDSTAPAWAQVSISDLASTEFDAGSSGTSKTLDWSNGIGQLLTLTGACTLTLTNPKPGFSHLVALKQDGTGSRTVTWPSSVKWAAGSAPTLTTTAGHVDLIRLTWYANLGASGNYLGEFVLNYTPA
jgi:hypothetical protein